MEIPVHMNIPVRSEEEQMEFYSQCLSRYKRAAQSSGIEKFYYDIAGTTVCLHFAGKALVPYLTPALEHLTVPPPENSDPDFVIYVWDSESTNVQMVPPPCDTIHFTDRGDIWGFNSKRIKTAFHWSEFSVNVMDLQTREAVYWIKTPKNLPYWTTSSPFRTLFHWWMEKNNCQLLHAAAVGTQDGAVLITGKGGMGKSTTALTCLHEGLFYTADDYLIVKKDPDPQVFSLYSTAKLNRGEVSSFNKFEKCLGKPVDKDQEKDVLYLYPAFKNQIMNKMPLRAILIPNVKQQDSTGFAKASYWRVYRAMSFSTMSQLPGVGSHTHSYLQELCRKLPIFNIELGQDFEKIPQAIAGYLRDPKQFSVDQKKKRDESEKPLVSVIIPVYNGEKFIRQAIENVVSQQYPALEIIVVEDGSTDNTSEIIESLHYDIRHFKKENSGPSAARNWGIKDASGKYIAFLDVDDLWPENNLFLLVNELEENEEIDIVRGHAQLFKNSKENDKELLGNPAESYPYYIGAGLYRRSVFNIAGLFDRTLWFGEDTDWYYRAREKKLNVKWLEEVTLYVRRHGENMTEGKSILELNKLKTFKKILDRDRKRNTEKKNH
ncbi:MAG: glycosyltransferase [Balneolaceae bacterium]|nr:glycosyltransferase [Balneolaceae bacterium]